MLCIASRIHVSKPSNKNLLIAGTSDQTLRRGDLIITKWIKTAQLGLTFNICFVRQFEQRSHYGTCSVAHKQLELNKLQYFFKLSKSSNKKLLIVSASDQTLRRGDLIVTKWIKTAKLGLTWDICVVRQLEQRSHYWTCSVAHRQLQLNKLPHFFNYSSCEY